MTTRPRLMVGRFGNAAAPSLLRLEEQPVRIGVRCSSPGWVQKIEYTERKRNYLAGFQAYEDDHGKRLALLDAGMDVIVDGWIYEVIPDGLFVHYVGGGAWRHHSDRLDTTAYAATDTVSDVITDTVTNYVSHVAADYSGLAGNATAVGSVFEVDRLTGSTPAQIIERLLPASDSNDAIWNYWVQSRPLSGTTLPYPQAYMAARSAAADVNWRVYRADLAAAPLAPRHIWDLATRVTVYYRPATNVNNGGGYAKGSTSIVVDDGSIFSDGDRVRLTLNGGGQHTTAISGVSGNTITINDDLPDAIDDNALVVNEEREAAATATNSAAESKYWRVDYAEQGADWTATMAAQRRDSYAGIYNDPVAQGGFTIVSPTVRDGYGAQYPLWYLLRRPGYIQVMDMYPAAALASLSLDAITSYYTMALDYDGYSLRVTPDNPDSRLDARLKRAGILPGEIVQRQTPTVTTHGGRYRNTR